MSESRDETTESGIELGTLLISTRSLGPAAIAERFGLAFLVRASAQAAKPRGPRETLRLSRDEISLGLTTLPMAEPGLDVELSGTSLVLPVRKSKDQPYRFFAIGRTRNCDVPLEDPSISKLHALLRLEPQGWTLQDAGSKNGTYLEGARVPTRSEGPPLLARSGNRITFGAVKTLFFTCDDIETLYAVIGA